MNWKLKSKTLESILVIRDLFQQYTDQTQTLQSETIQFTQFPQDSNKI